MCSLRHTHIAHKERETTVYEESSCVCECKCVTVFLIFMNTVCLHVCMQHVFLQVARHYWPRVQRKFTPPFGGSAALHTDTHTMTHTNTHRLVLHTLQSCSRVLSLNGDHSETNASVTMLSSISRLREEKRKTSETEKFTKASLVLRIKSDRTGSQFIKSVFGCIQTKSGVAVKHCRLCISVWR